MAVKNRLTFFLVPLVIGLIIGLAVATRFDFSASSQGQSVPKPVIADAQSAAALGIEDAVINVASTVGKAVVSISTEHTEKLGGGPQGQRRFYFEGPSGENPFGGDPLDRFFDDFFGGMPREFKQRGLGSGVIIDEEGYILTNEHVVSQADKITVKLPDGREFKGQVKGKDARSDLAIVKIDAKNLPVAKLGDSDNVKIGQWVVAIGNPFGFAMDNAEPTVTSGVVSALHRTLGVFISRNRDYSDLIQTDAAINPGNSGGPLVNLKGEVIGINVAIFSTSGGYQGIGFAIPVNSAKNIMSQLIEGKRVLYGWLGVTVQDLDENLAKYFGLADKSGVVVSNVIEGSPAKKGGIKEGDVITKIDGQKVPGVKELLSVVGKMQVGKKVSIVLLRDKREMTLQIEVGERPEDLEKLTRAGLAAPETWRGIKVAPISPEQAARFGLEDKTGVVVVEVEPGSAADEAGITPGDVIMEIDRKAITGISDYQKAVVDAKGDSLLKTNRGYLVINGEQQQ